MSDIDLLSSSDFIEYVQRIGENLRESIPDNPDGLIKEIFNRLPSLETHSIQICLKILALLFEQCQVRRSKDFHQWNSSCLFIRFLQQ